MNWFFAFEENYKCKDSKIQTINDIKNSGFEIIPATVPGNVETDLMKCGKLPDIYYSVNTLEAMKLENMHYWYFAEFELDSDEYFLNFEGIDTIADIYVNGNLAKQCDNMFIAHEVYGDFTAGKNEVVVHIKPVCIEARKYNAPAGTKALKYNMETLSLRKATHMFGWDIMPRIVSAGIWKDVEIKKIKDDAIEDVYITTQHIDFSQNTAYLSVAVHTKLSGDFARDYTLKLNAKCKHSEFSFEETLWHTDGRFQISVQNPQLWWPKNYGEPKLYDINLELCYKGKTVDTKSFKFGIRTVKLHTREMVDENDRGDFCFEVNGKRIFVLGSNWVPLDALHSNDINRLDKAMEMAVDLGCNMLRCWGGNVYESEKFYELCDENGIMVWQDFAMACGMYPTDDDIARKLEKEAVYQIKRLRNHTCIVLWAGDNECDIMRFWQKFVPDPNINTLTREVLRRAVENHDYTTPYLPSSPYVSPKSMAEKLKLPEDHLWGPRDYFKGEYYKNSVCHFVSETGYQGFPSVKSLKKFLKEPEKIFNDDGTTTDEYLVHATAMETKDGAPYTYRIRISCTQVETLFGKAEENLADFVRKSQISQAEAIKYFIEKSRISKGYRTGILWWNLVDGWPQVSDAVVDYYYSKKLAYHFIKRSQNPVCLMFDEPDSNGCIKLIGVNEFSDDAQLEYTVTDVLEGKNVMSGTAVLKSDCASEIASLSIESGEQKFYLIKWKKDGIESTNHYFTNIINTDYHKYLTALKNCGMDEFDE